MSIPVILLTGYLGAGKTTALNRLLASPWVRELSPALIINEFGRLGVDGKLVDGHTRKYEINKGSLFCTCTQHQLVQAMGEIAASPGTGLVIIESTGIAETRSLEGALAIPALTSAFRLQANICVVDATGFIKIAAFLAIATAQVRWADGLLITKGDQVPDGDVDSLLEVLHGLNPDAPVCVAPFGRGVEDFAPTIRHIERKGGPMDSPPTDIVSVSIETDIAFDRQRFMAAMAALGPRLLRLKGNVTFAGEGPRFVEVVHNRVTEADAKPGFATLTAFSAIAWHVHADELRRQLEPDQGRDHRPDKGGVGTP
ncbi:MAG: GTP-binding protein [bacterium]